MIKIYKNRANKIFRELNLSDIKILFSLIHHIDESGFTVLTPLLKARLQTELNLSRQTFGASLHRLYEANLILVKDGKTFYNDEYILI